MITRIIIVISCLLYIKCKPGDRPEEVIKPQEHFNFILCSDLSNRLTLNNKNKTKHDTILIGNFIDFYYPEIYTDSNRITIGSQDKIQTLFYRDKNINDFNISENALDFDLSKPKFNDSQRIDYLQQKEGNYKQDKENFKKEIGKLYASVVKRPQGADTYNLFKSKVSTVITDEKKYRNILLIFTDGYIEYGSKEREGNRTRYLDQALVNEFRRKYKKSNDGKLTTKESLIDFFVKEKYGLEPVFNEDLETLEVLALEFYDRNKTKNSATVQTPSDLEIITMFWEDWMRQSNVKRFKSYEVFGKEAHFKNKVIDFIKNKSSYKLN